MNTNMNSNEMLSDEERQPCEIWTRVMGYHRPVSEFNKGKKSEFASRKAFVERAWFAENCQEDVKQTILK
ncbi:MAG: anaerobic ribonucleoside-triphosphate reductase [Alphaproteobacteria bacterium]